MYYWINMKAVPAAAIANPTQNSGAFRHFRESAFCKTRDSNYIGPSCEHVRNFMMDCK